MNYPQISPVQKKRNGGLLSCPLAGGGPIAATCQGHLTLHSKGDLTFEQVHPEQNGKEYWVSET